MVSTLQASAGKGIGFLTVSHLMHLVVPRHVGRHVHGQPVGPSHQWDAAGLGIRIDLLHPCDKVVHVLVYDGLQASLEAAAESRGHLPGHFTMPDRVLFPDETAEVLPTVLEVGLDEVFHVLVLW